MGWNLLPFICVIRCNKDIKVIVSHKFLLVYFIESSVFKSPCVCRISNKWLDLYKEDLLYAHSLTPIMIHGVQISTCLTFTDLVLPLAIHQPQVPNFSPSICSQLTYYCLPSPQHVTCWILCYWCSEFEYLNWKSANFALSIIPRPPLFWTPIVFSFMSVAVISCIIFICISICRAVIVSHSFLCLL